jgi:hypothetical protein
MRRVLFPKNKDMYIQGDIESPKDRETSVEINRTGVDV